MRKPFSTKIFRIMATLEDSVMERRYRVRLDELLGDALVDAALLRGLLPRLERFLEPFVASLLSPEQRTHAHHYIAGLLSDLDRKNAEGIAYLHDQQRQGLQKFLGQANWDHRPLLRELTRQVADRLGEPDGVLILDPSAFPKKGTASVGVQRQWCGRLGKVDNCQVGIYLGYASRREHALVDCRLYLPKEWAADKTRRQKAGVAKKVRFRTRHELALALLEEHGPVLPHAWVAGDDEMGRSGWFRQQLRQRGERYLLAVPSNTLVRDLAAPEPPYSGRGRRPRVPFVRVQRWCAALTEAVWQTVEVRDGEKGPLVVQATWGLVQARHGSRPVDVAEMVVIFRERQGNGTWKHDYLLSNAPLETSLEEFARVFKAEHRIEECLQRAKSEAGLADYQVRTWEGWHHHQALSLLATWFLTEETRRGKKIYASVDGASGAVVPGASVASGVGMRPTRVDSSAYGPSAAAERGGSLLPLQETQTAGTASS
jgi:SRSO17 transposase